MRLKKLTSVIYYSYDIDLSTSRLSRKIERNRYVFYIDFFTTRDWTYIYAPVLMQKLCKNYSYPKIEIFHSFFKTVFARSSFYENKVLSPNFSKPVPADIS